MVFKEGIVVHSLAWNDEPYIFFVRHISHAGEATMPEFMGTDKNVPS